MIQTHWSPKIALHSGEGDVEACNRRECVRDMGGSGRFPTAALFPVSEQMLALQARRLWIGLLVVQAHPGAGQIQEKAPSVPAALCSPVGSLYGHMASQEIFPTLKYVDHYGHLCLQPRHNTLNTLAFHYICTRTFFKSCCTSIGRIGTTPALTSLYWEGLLPGLVFPPYLRLSTILFPLSMLEAQARSVFPPNNKCYRNTLGLNSSRIPWTLTQLSQPAETTGARTGARMQSGDTVLYCQLTLPLECLPL